MRHIVNVMRPTKAVGDYGEAQGNPETVIAEWPCSIEPLSGRESEIARQTVPTATHRIKGYGDPHKPIDANCYLVMLPITEPPRKLEVGFVKDVKMNGVELELICGEQIHA